METCLLLKEKSAYVIVLSLLCLDISNAATQAQERVSQAVTLTFYHLSVPASFSSSFGSIIAPQTISYCDVSLASCGLNSNATFSASDVGTSTPKEDGSNHLVTFYIDYPASASVTSGGQTQHVLPKAAAQAIAEQSIDLLEDQFNSNIIYIDDEYFGIPPDSTANAIIITIAIGIVFGLAITVVALTFYKKRKEREAKILARKAEKQGYGSSTHTSAPNTVLETTTTTVLSPRSLTPRHTTAASKQVSPNYMDGGNGLSPNDSQDNFRGKSAGPITEYNDDIHKRNNGLPPLQQAEVDMAEETEEARKERKRRRREKRKEKKRQQEQSLAYENRGLDSSALTEGDSDSNALPKQHIATFSVDRGPVV